MAVFFKKKNNAKGSISEEITISDTEVTLNSGDGAGFPQTGTFRATMHNGNEDPDTGEIVTAAFLSGDTFTIVRAQESTSAQAWSEGTVFRMYITAGQIEEIEAAINGLNVSSLVSGEVPGGTLNGTNTAFTTAASYQAGSLKVFQNGIRLKAGGIDYTETSSGFTMVVAPLSGDIILVDYNTTPTALAAGSTSFIYNEVPSGLVNGTNAVYTLSRGYVAGTTLVFRDGQLMRPDGHDYTETTPGSGIITFVAAPLTDTLITISYQAAVSTAGNADTVDGYHASQLLADWKPITASVTFSSVDNPTGVVLITGDFTGVLSKAMKIRFLNGANTIYGIISDTPSFSGGNTTVKFLHEINPATSLARALMANSAISGFVYSTSGVPFGFPFEKLKWTVEVIDTTNRQQLTPTNGTWYNLGSIKIDVPIGAWELSYSVNVNPADGSNTAGQWSTLSTTNNGSTDPNFVAIHRVNAPGASSLNLTSVLSRTRPVDLTAKTSYYLNGKSHDSVDSINLGNADDPCILRAVSTLL